MKTVEGQSLSWH